MAQSVRYLLALLARGPESNPKDPCTEKPGMVANTYKPRAGIAGTRRALWLQSVSDHVSKEKKKNERSPVIRNKTDAKALHSSSYPSLG